MLKKILKGLGVILTLYVAAGLFVGNYFVNYALKRGTSEDPVAPPAASQKIADPSLNADEMPNYRHEETTITSKDGLKLYADVFYPKDPSNRWAILVHGYGRNRTFAWGYADYYLANGYNVITPDLRGAGKSEGEYLTMGTLEAEDICLWAKNIAARHEGSDIVLHGVSMGAATVMLAGALNPPNTVALVEDCGYTSAYKMFGGQLEKLFHLPREPIMPWVNLMCKLKTGVFLTDASPAEYIEKVNIPTLFIHGTADKLVPFDMMKELYGKSGAKMKEKFPVEGVGHADAKAANPKAYFERIWLFLENTD